MLNFYSARAQPHGIDGSESIFSPDASPWDHILEDAKLSSAPDHKHTPYNPRILKSTSRYSRSVSMTHSERESVQGIMDFVFNQALAASKGSEGGLGEPRSPSLSGFYTKMSHYARRQHWATDADVELDRKKEEMELCETDLQLLEWAMREVFGESQRYEAAARAAVKTMASRSSPKSTSTAPTASSQTPFPASPQQLQPQSYPHVLAALMRTFRDKYSNPHLALAVFEHARRLSPASFAFGCTTPAYNELLHTRWAHFRDLRGVAGALEEMRANGIALDARTRALAEAVRADVGARTLWQEEGAFGTGETWELVARIERLALRRPTAPAAVPGVPTRSESRSAFGRHYGGRGAGRKRESWREGWKAEALEKDGKDGWEFGKWEEKSESKTGFRGERSGRDRFRDGKRALRF